MGQEKNLFCGYLSPTTKGKPYRSLLHAFSFIRSQGVPHTDRVLGIIQLTVPWYLFFAQLHGFSLFAKLLILYYRDFLFSFTEQLIFSLVSYLVNSSASALLNLIAAFPTQHNFHTLLGFSLLLKHSRLCPQTERGSKSRVHPIGCPSLRDHNQAKQLFGTIMPKCP